MTTSLSIVPAGAGAGKTHHIQETLTGWVRSGLVRPERILAVTFTEAAASELRQRIRTALIKDGNLAAALAVDRAYVSTIHALGRRLLVEHAFACGTSPQQRLIAEDEQDLLIRRAIDESPALGKISRDLAALGYRPSFTTNETAEDSFRARLMEVIALLRSLGPRGSDPAMADFVEQSIRVGYGPTPLPAATLDAGLKQAVDALLSRFPGSLAEQANSDSARKSFREDFRNLTQMQRALADRRDDWKMWQKLRGLRLSKRGAPTPEGYDELAGRVMAAAERLVVHPGPLEQAVSHARALVEGAQAALSDYEERKRKLGVIDFGDMVSNASRLLAENPAVLASVMDEVDCVIVDEFQDTNPIQFSFLWTLAKQAGRALIVGDTKQAIMGFQGADPRLMEALTAQFKTSPLVKNWRSDARIMGFVNALGPRLFGTDYRALAPTEPAGTDSALELISLPAKRSARTGAKPEHHVADRVLAILEEQPTIVDRHSKQARPLVAADISLLCPTHKLGAAYAKALRDLGLPARIAEEGWWQSRLVQVTGFAMRLAVDPDDSHAALFIATMGPAGVPFEEALKDLASGHSLSTPELEALRTLSPAALAMPVDRLVHEVIRVSGLRGWCDRLDDPAQMRADLLRFEAEAAAFMAAHRDMREASGFYGQSANVFLGWLENRMAQKGEDQRPNPSGAEAEGIEIVTWHASKGREWPVVIVCGLDHAWDPRAGTFSTIFPDFSDLDRAIDKATLAYAPDFAAPEATDRFLNGLRPEADKTARRLLYVALTRARNRLVIEWPQAGDGASITAEWLLREACDFKTDDQAIDIGGSKFPARIIPCANEMPAAFDVERGTGRAHGPREPRFAIRRPGPAILQPVLPPSRITEASRPLPANIETRAITPGAVLADEAMAAATDKGTAVHEALRILLLRPDLKARVAAHCRLNDAQVDTLAAQAGALRALLAEHGYPSLHVEQPLELPLPDGGRLNMTIDLVAEGDDGCMIIDHKSGAVPDPKARFVTYWPQLAAYADAVEHIGGKPVKGIAIYWTNSGEITLTEWS
jgi:ATP-dependent exoDNAse (exonuclease V) beta subunit